MGILRLLFALSVVSFHTEGTILKFFDPFGAVLSFFIISGFYMALILDNKYKSKAIYYLSRALRIYPIYWITLIATISLGLLKTSFLGGDTNSTFHYFQYSHHLNGLNFMVETINYILRNVTIIFDKDYFGINDNRAAGYLILYQAWTLPIELVFYALAPFILKIKKDFLFFIALYFIIFYGLISPLQLIPENSLTFSVMRYFIYFLLGVASYRYVYKRIQNKVLPSWTKLIYIGLILFIVFYRYLPLEGSFQYFGPSLLFYHIPFAIFISFVFQISKNNKWDTALGELSYPVYMTHFIFIKFFNALPISPTTIPSTLIVMALTIIFSYLLVKFVQNPIDRFRHYKLKKLQMLNLGQ